MRRCNTVMRNRLYGTIEAAGLARVWLCVCLVSVLAAAAVPAVSSQMQDTQEEMNLYVGEIKTVQVSGLQKFLVSRPEVVEVSESSPLQLTLIAKAPGVSSFVIWDNFGEQEYKIRVFAEDMKEIKQRLDNILKELDAPDVYTRPVDSENKVLLLGQVKTVQERDRILTALGTMKDKIVDLIKIREEEAVVDIDVQVLELDKDGTKNMGFTWPGSLSVTDQSSSARSSSGAPVSWSTIFDVTQWTRANLEWKLDLLVREGKARILSRPSLACQSGKEAELLVGGEKPIMATTVAGFSGAKATNVAYKEFGIKLDIKPIISEDRRVKISLKVDVSDVESPVSIGSTRATTALAYAFTKRTAATELFLDDGQTLAIGGLIRRKTEEEIRQMPWLGDIPVLGLFFRKKEIRSGSGGAGQGNTELFITITPTIIDKHKKAVQPKPLPLVETKPQAGISAEDPLRQYARVVQEKIMQYIQYPRMAKEAGFSGTVKVSLRLSYRGQLLQSRIKESSGYRVLDEYTLQAIQAIGSYPPFPPALLSREVWLDIPVSYSQE
ncbi:MAG TPA: TonB family protein [Patescibacteria group bacterium]|nr:TonB family protein [Patescibacteria group bacterium]